MFAVTMSPRSPEMAWRQFRIVSEVVPPRQVGRLGDGGYEGVEGGETGVEVECTLAIYPFAVRTAFLIERKYQSLYVHTNRSFGE